MPKLWTETIEEHRAAVWHAIVDTTARLVAEGGLRSVTMSRVAEEVGIGRATLYKYFPDVDTIMFKWHEHQVSQHLEHLKESAQQPGSPSQRLRSVLETYALNRNEQGGHELAGLLHKGEHMAHAEIALTSFIEELLRAGVKAGETRDDIAPGELATYCVHALSAATGLPSKAAVRRLVALTTGALTPEAATKESSEREHATTMSVSITCRECGTVLTAETEDALAELGMESTLLEGRLTDLLEEHRTEPLAASVPADEDVALHDPRVARRVRPARGRLHRLRFPIRSPLRLDRRFDGVQHPELGIRAGPEADAPDGHACLLEAHDDGLTAAGALVSRVTEDFRPEPGSRQPRPPHSTRGQHAVLLLVVRRLARPVRHHDA